MATAHRLVVFILCFASTTFAQTTKPSSDDFWPRVQGSVVDAVTGEPIAEFSVAYGSDDSIPFWKTYDANTGKDGKFDYRPRKFRPGAYQIQVTAVGYKHGESRLIEFNERDVTLEFKLQRAPMFTAKVMNPDGTPVAGARVIVVAPGTSLNVGNGKVRAEKSILADDNGGFSAFLESDRTQFVVLHDAGYALVKATAARDAGSIQLERWSTIDCSVAIGGKPTNRASVFSRHEGDWDDTAYISFASSGVTDESGNVQLTYVRPGNTSVAVNGAQQMAMRSRGWGSTGVRETPVNTKTGESSTVRIGGDGSDVVGRMISPHRGVDWTLAMARLYPKPVGNSLALEDWQSNILKRRAIPVEISADGSFRAVDVPPGEWRLDAMLFGPTDPKTHDIMPYIGGVPGTVTVPKSDATPQERAAIDMGELPAKFIVILSDGAAAPNFELTTLAGEKHRLRDFRGKWVALDFWATWCGPCVRELPELKKSWERLKGVDDVIVLGLSLDDDEAKLRSFVDEHGYGWMHARIGGKSDVAKAYGVTGIPRMILVDPEGNLRTGVGPHGLDGQIEWRRKQKSPATKPS